MKDKDDEDNGLRFFKGVAFAVPIGIVLWVIIIYVLFLVIR